MQLRATNLERMAERDFDVLIVGGGINGAVCAAALAAQGASVALVDRGDFAGETSQASSNLVWGGIKYLETFEFGLVRKLCMSRNRLIDSYPSTIKEIRFFASLARGFRRSRFTIFLGTLLYWLMGNFFTRRPRLLSRADITRDEPVVNTDELSGGVEYSDAYLHDNDARFVFQFVRSALDYGAVVANYVEAKGSRRDGEVWVTALRDRVGGREFDLRSRVFINACGPWADEYSERSHVTTRFRHLFSKGVHLIIDRISTSGRVLAFFADDGRLFFAIPMGNKTCIGTTDTRVAELPTRVTDEDRRFILDNINKRLELDRPLTEADILSERCGVRPLVVANDVGAPTGGDWTALSRKHEIDVDTDRRRISIYGGKLTDCLNVGEGVTDAVVALGVALPYRGVTWYGEPSPTVRDEFFHQARLMGLDDMTAPESSEVLSTRLWRRYGMSALAMLEKIRQDPDQAEVLIKGTEYIRAEIEHAARCEMVTKLADFLRRRSKIALVERTDTIRQAPGLQEACRILFGDQAQERLDEYFGDERAVDTAAPEVAAELAR
ncbi:glycerol-3-phosphate dehydrogenase/oxidase [Haliangium sp.]|uniref:glycerol-3-phosphate dehydrogenase/oxidase n=1 Tax=Haliangium sp. TaxID=2663208 RepID=UPI003D14F63E